MGYTTSTCIKDVAMTYVGDTQVSLSDVRWAMELAVQALQGAANVQDWETYCNKVAEGTIHILGTEKMIIDELDI